MYELIQNFPAQIERALELAGKIELHHSYSNISNVVICGLGGSGIGGDLAYDLTINELTVPLVVNKGYDLPHFINNKTLLILCSYSGNTEETISCANQSTAKGLTPICISANGKLKELALNQKFDFIQLPTGFPPRTTLGYGAAILLTLLKKFSLIQSDVDASLKTTAQFLASNQESIKDIAKDLAKTFKDKTVIIHTEEKIESVALRIKQQINENSKSNCWYSPVPELNHNELVGWKTKNETLAALFLRTKFENKRNQLRFEFVKPVVEGNVNVLREIHAVGETFMEQYFYLVHLGDWLSYYLGLEHGQDPVEVNVIDRLKAFLNSVD